MRLSAASCWRASSVRRRSLSRHCRFQIMSSLMGISFLIGMVRSVGALILKSASVAGKSSRYVRLVLLRHVLEHDLPVVRRLSCKLNLQAGMDR